MEYLMKSQRQYLLILNLLFYLLTFYSTHFVKFSMDFEKIHLHSKWQKIQDF